MTDQDSGEALDSLSSAPHAQAHLELGGSEGEKQGGEAQSLGVGLAGSGSGFVRLQGMRVESGCGVT